MFINIPFACIPFSEEEEGAELGVAASVVDPGEGCLPVLLAVRGRDLPRPGLQGRHVRHGARTTARVVQGT